ncbi:MAG: hypothetical protein U5R31_14435 [Acidimicrobiia bacterium]|nr:hypothetical protein [Acidimicrobiia bacterium]
MNTGTRGEDEVGEALAGEDLHQMAEDRLARDIEQGLRHVDGVG